MNKSIYTKEQIETMAKRARADIRKQFPNCSFFFKKWELSYCDARTMGSSLTLRIKARIVPNDDEKPIIEEHLYNIAL